MLRAVGLLQSLSSIPLLPMTDKKEKKCQFGYSEILLLQGKVHLRAWACSPFLLSSCSFFYTVYCLALRSLPPSFFSCLVFSTVSLFLPSSSTLLTLTLLHSFFCCFFFSPSPFSPFGSPSLVSSLQGSFGSERRFGARQRQYFTLIKRMVGSTVGAAQEHFSS